MTKRKHKATHTVEVQNLSWGFPKRVTHAHTVPVRLTPKQIIVVEIPPEARNVDNGVIMGGRPEEYRYWRENGRRVVSGYYWSHADIKTLAPITARDDAAKGE